jgi:gamma-tubulin complex component 3
MKLTHHEFLSSIIKHKLINGSDSSSKGKTSGKTYVSQLNSLINTAFRFILTMVELHGVKYDAQYLAPDIHILRREGNIYDNLLKLFQDFNSDLKVFVADLNHDDEMELRYLGISLNQ